MGAVQLLCLLAAAVTNDTSMGARIDAAARGIRDYWPQDFVPPEMLRATSTAAIMEEWARRPLDFEPGTQWQYSNTGYVVAGAIVEKVAGTGLMDFLQRHIFTPLKMEHVTEDDTRALPAADAMAYTRQGLGPTRHAPKEGPGWLYAAGELAMTPRSLALWDISLIDRSLLQPASCGAMLEEVTLKDGTKKGYGLGLDIERIEGRARIGHDGAGSGFLSSHRIWPSEKTAVIVLTNNDWASPDDLLNRIAFIVLPPNPAEARARAVFSQFQLIQLDRESRRGGMVTRVWKILCHSKRLQAIERGYPDGKLEQFLVVQRND